MANCDFLQTPFSKAGKQLSFIPDTLMIINENIELADTQFALFHGHTVLMPLEALL